MKKCEYIGCDNEATELVETYCGSIPIFYSTCKVHKKYLEFACN